MIQLAIFLGVLLGQVPEPYLYSPDSCRQTRIESLRRAAVGNGLALEILRELDEEAARRADLEDYIGRVVWQGSEFLERLARANMRLLELGDFPVDCQTGPCVPRLLGCEMFDRDGDNDVDQDDFGLTQRTMQ